MSRRAFSSSEGVLARWLPISHWLRRYTREDFGGDLVAGILTAILLVPQGMAFALLAGLPPQVGLYASILPPIVYAALGTSRALAVGPVSVAAIMVAYALQDLPPGSDPAAAALMLAALAAGILLLMGLLRLGVLATLLSHPVLSGFTSAAAVIIIASQLPSLTGVPLPGATSFADFPAALLDAIARTSLATAALGIGAIVLLLAARTPLERFLVKLGMQGPRVVLVSRASPLAVVLLSTLAVSAWSLHQRSGVAVVGAIPAGLPELGFDSLPWNIAPALLPAALLIGLVSYVESLSIAKSLANRNRQRIDANQELIALGGANFAAAVSGGMPVAGGFSRTMVNYNAGARTQLASLVTAALVGLVAAFFAHLLSTVPKAALAAIIVVAVVKLIDLRGALAVWRYDRLDGGVLAITAAAVLIIGIEIGLAIGIAASLGSLVLRMSRPHIAVLGRIAGSEHFRNVRRHRVETWPQLLFMRVDENMTFTNAGRIESAIVSEIAAHPPVIHVILVMSSVSVIDSTAVESMERLAQSLRPSGVSLHLSDVKGPVMDRLRHSNLLAAIAPGQVFLSANVAAEDLSRRQD